MIPYNYSIPTHDTLLIMPTRYFRAGVGIVIYNSSYEVAFFERVKHPAGWEFPQGGISLNEHLNDTLWRELHEEVGLLREDIFSVTEFPDWLSYQEPETYIEHSIPRIGQIHHWFFLKLKPDTDIDLARATDNEFKNWKWSSFIDATKEVDPRKQRVYETLCAFFFENIQKTPL